MSPAEMDAPPPAIDGPPVYNPFDPAFRANPYPFYDRLRADQDANTMRDRMQQLGVVVRAIGADTLTFCPPLVITDDQIDRVVDAVAEAAAV